MIQEKCRNDSSGSTKDAAAAGRHNFCHIFISDRANEIEYGSLQSDDDDDDDDDQTTRNNESRRHAKRMRRLFPAIPPKRTTQCSGDLAVAQHLPAAS